ncbi:hypothetical protein HPB49_002567 [Dermacentor silvarum]|uniref:Uncharacterized protein n=1 Tax=Dermacentor silvarum TaxID=543639 RepID=A0ACB8CD44_DERSI|nr:hypothetical protein HPB49_002567 [Dermacentor silvarum]
MVASTPKRENVNRYVRMRQILISGKVYELSAYETTPHSTCKGVIRNIPLQDGPDVIDAKIAGARHVGVDQFPLPYAYLSKKEEADAILGRHGPRGACGPQRRRPVSRFAPRERARGGRKRAVKQEMSRPAAEMAEIRKLALSPSPAQPASVSVPVAMDTSEESH